MLILPPYKNDRFLLELPVPRLPLWHPAPARGFIQFADEEHVQHISHFPKLNCRIRRPQVCRLFPESPHCRLFPVSLPCLVNSLTWSSPISCNPDWPIGRGSEPSQQPQHAGYLSRVSGTVPATDKTESTIRHSRGSPPGYNSINTGPRLTPQKIVVSRNSKKSLDNNGQQG